jgi:hypothetical protein
VTKRSYLGALLLTAMASFGIQPAYALPFNKDVQSFQRYLNQLRWSDGIKREFFRLSSCGYKDLRTDLPIIYEEVYKCNYGFLKIYDPRGIEICKLTFTWENGDAVRYTKYFKSGQSRNTFSIADRESDCRYQ